MILFVAFGYFIGGFLFACFVLPSAFFKIQLRWIFRLVHEKAAKSFDERGEVERAIHLRAAMALIEHYWKGKDALLTENEKEEP